MNRYMHPDEQEEMEYQAWGRYDYLNEAFGAEARALRAQAEDDARFEYECWLKGLTPEDRAAHEAGLLLADEAYEEARRIEAADATADLPF